MTILLKDGSLKEIIVDLEKDSVAFSQDGAIEEMLKLYQPKDTRRRRLDGHLNINKLVKFDRFTALSIGGKVSIYDNVAKKKFYEIDAK
jgi:hypothetical protein